MGQSTARRLVALGCVLMLCAASGAAQRGRAPAAPDLPPLSMTCPHHPDVIETSPGICPICKLTLVPVRLAPAWTCAVHPATIADRGGTCPICRRQLVPVTVALTWTCSGSTAEHLERGLCTDGAPMTLKRTLRPHGDHNPRHGGQFFMAPDSWHHVEGVYPAERVFRLYVYDDYARPLPPARLRAIKARLVTSERFDPATRTTRELRAFTLKTAGNGAYLEARLDRLPLPADMTAKVQFTGDTPEHRFDFTFHATTKSPIPQAPTTAVAAKPRSGDAAPQAKPASSDAAQQPESGDADLALVPLPIPETVDGILEQLRVRNRQIAELIERGNTAAVWVPAFQAKDLAVALEAHLAHLTPAQRETAAPALERVVRLAWLLDAHGDTGNRQQVTAAHAAFSSAVADVVSVFGGGR